jgi:hypothetical protein
MRLGIVMREDIEVGELIPKGLQRGFKPRDSISQSRQRARPSFARFLEEVFETAVERSHWI